MLIPVTIHLVRPADAEELLAFELRNRAFFRASIPDRPDSYYHLDHVRSTIATAMAEAEAGTWYAYLIRNGAGALVGRINLSKSGERTAELGYRVGAAHNGKGYATAAVGLALTEAFSRHGLHRIEARTTAENAASQQVLLRNGFQFAGEADGFVLFAKEDADGNRA